MPGTKSSGTAVPVDGPNRTQNRPRTTSHLLAGAVNPAEEVAAGREAEQGAEREEVPGEAQEEAQEEVQSVQEGVDEWRPEAGRSRVFPTVCLYCGVPPGLGYILCHISRVRFSCLSMLICH